MQLRQILRDLPALSVEGSVEREITGVAYDSRRVTPGMLFVAIPGARTDGHEHISEALERGAVAVICERNGFLFPRAARVKVADARAALARVSAAYYQNPSSRLRVIGVTGTNGKTTVSFMVKTLLEAAGERTGLLGTVQYEIGDRVIPAQRTTPEALETQQMMSQMVRAGCRACVMEVSSHALAQQRVLGIDWDVAIFTNLTRDHLDYHGTMEAYFESKKKLFAALSQGPKKGAAIINIDDVYGARLAGENKVEVEITYGVEGAARLRATNLRLGSDGSAFTAETPSGPIECRIPLIGRHNVYNALAAIGAALALKVDTGVIQRSLETMPVVPGRLERVDAGQPFGVFVDYAHTDDALKNVLVTIREITAGRLLLVFGCGGSRDAGKRPRMGAVAAELADFSVITSDNPRKENPESIIAQVESGFRSVRTDGYAVEVDRRRAIEHILAMARPGDTVLIAGKGHETYQEFEDTIIPFDDRINAREAYENIALRNQSR